MIRVKEVFEVRCDRCGCALGEDTDSCAWHFDTRASALAELTDNQWTQTAGRVLCAACVQREACALLGHDWSPWQPLEVPHTTSFTAFEAGLFSNHIRRCDLCDATELDPPRRIDRPSRPDEKEA